MCSEGSSTGSTVVQGPRLRLTLQGLLLMIIINTFLVRCAARSSRAGADAGDTDKMAVRMEKWQ